MAANQPTPANYAKEIKELKEQVVRLEAAINRLSTIVEGNPPFPGVTPMVEDISAIRKDVEGMTDLIERAKWAAAALGLTNAGGIIAIFSRWFGGG